MIVRAKTHKCDSCEKAFTSGQSLKKHVCSKKEIPIENICQICNKVVIKEYMEFHVKRVHQNIRNFECDKCGKKFASK